MHYELRQSTASQEVSIGIFLDDTDGKTPETALTIANTDIKIHKAGATAEANKNSGGATHMAGGRYSLVLDATDTSALGSGRLDVQVAGALPCGISFSVLSPAYYDAKYGTAPMAANVTAIADPIMYKLGALDVGTAQSATSTTIVLRAAAAFADSALNGCIIIQTGGTNSPQAALVTGYVGATDTATVAAWPNGTPAGTITYVVWGTVQAASSGGLDAAGVRGALGMASANLDTQINLLQSDTDNIQTRLPAALVSGRMDASVGAMAANTMTAAAAAADLTTELQAGLATASALSTVAGYVDTEVAAIKAKTDNLPVDPADASDIAASMSTMIGYVDTEVAAIKVVTDKLGTTFMTDGANFKFTGAALIETPAGAGGGLDAAGVRGAIGMTTANMDTQLSAINSKTTNLPSDPADQSLIMDRLGTPAGASIAADIAGVSSGSGLDAAGVRAAVGLAAANLDTQISAVATPAQVASALATYDGPTKAEMDAALVEVDANVKKVNGVAVKGAGTVGDPWSPL